MRTLTALALALAATAPASVPEPQVVRIDVIATDSRGRAVPDLQPADFELRDNGVVQRLDSARFIRPSGPPAAAPAAVHTTSDEQAQAENDDARLFAIYLDEYHVSAGANTERARDALDQFVETELRPDDLVAIMRPLDSVLQIRMTRDREALRTAIAGFKGRRGEYTPATAFEATYMGSAPDSVEHMRAQVTLSALHALAVHLGRLRAGRKAMLIVTEALPRTAPVRGYERLPDLESVVRTANRYNVSLYPYDPAAPNAPGAVGSDTTADLPGGLDALARDTDGRTIRAGASGDAGIGAMAHDSNAYYLLSYTATHPEDGRFHDVRVHVRRKGVQVRTRVGYWALAPDEAIRLNAGPAKPAIIDLGPRRTSPLIRPWFGLSRGQNGRTRVTFAWEPAPRVPGDRDRRLPPARVALKAVDSDEQVVFEGPVRPAGASEDDMNASASFEVKPGTLHLRMGIEDATTKQIDFDTRDLTIRALDGDVVLGTPEVLRAGNALAFRRLVANPDAAPISTRVFRRSDILLVRVVAYGPADGPGLALSARLLGQKGQAMRDLPIRSEEATGRQVIDLPLAGLASGDYTLELVAAAGRGSARELLTFRVTS